MTSTNQRIRAVFLTALLVLSVFGGTVFAGTAAAGGTIGADFGGASTFVAQGGEPVPVNGDIVDEGDHVIIYIDKNGNGMYDDGNGESIATGENKDGSFDTTFSAPAGSSLENPEATNVYVVSNAYEGAPLSDSNSYEEHTQKVGTLVVDDTNVNFNANSPEDGDIVNTATPEIRQNITDVVSGVDEESIQVTIRKDGAKFYTYNVDSSAQDDGVKFSDNNLTILPGDGNVPVLEDGDYTVSISASDEAGNDGALTSFSFTVDTEEITFDLNSPTDGETVSDVTQTIGVTLKSQNDIASANLTVYNESGEYSETLSEEALSTEDVFTFVPGTGELAELPNGTIYVDVNATDNAGNYNEASYSFEVDNIRPNVESVQLSSDAINTENDESETLTVTFDEPVDAGSVGAVVSDGDGNTATLSSVVSSDGKVVTLVFDVSSLSATTNESALVEITAASDLNGNALNQTKNTTFAIDTETPTITISTIGDGDAISGYANLSQDVTVTGGDVDSVSRFVLVGDTTYDEEEDQDDLKQIEDIEYIDTREYAEGAHTLVVYATDESGNTVFETREFYVDNEDVTISFVGDDVVTGEVDISSLFSVKNVGVEDVTYTYAKGDGAFQKAESFNVNELGEEEYTVRAEVADPGYDGSPVVLSETISGEKLTADDLEITAAQNESNAGLIDVTISTTNGLTLDSINTSITAVDGHVDEFDGVFGFSTSNWEETASGYEYTATFYAPRDGAYEFAIDEATSGGQQYDASVDGPVSPVSADADGSAAEITDAHVVDGGSHYLDILVRFDEPVGALDANHFEFAGDADVVGVVDNGDGTAIVTLDAEAQTADAPELRAVDVVEATGDLEANTSAVGVDTIALELEEGVNVVSIPAETGSVAVEDVFDHASIEAVYVYEGDGEWSSYAPGASENSLSTLEGGEGYVVKATSAVTLDVNAENVPADDAAQAIQSQHLDAGWNLIGHYQEGSQSVGQALAPLGDWTYSVQKGYTGTQVDRLDAGEGYWLFVGQSGYHVPVDYEGMNSERPTVANVQVTDDNGGELEQGDTVTISADVADENIVDSIYADSSLLGFNAELTDDDNDGTYTATTTVDFGDVNPGDTYGVSVTAMDVDGNVGYNFGSAPAVETNAPSSSVSASFDDATNVLTVTVTGDEALDASSISVDVTDSNGAVTTLTGFTETDATNHVYEASYTVGGSVDDTYTATLAAATDIVGNSDSNVGSASVDVAIDTTAPSASIDSPSEGDVTNVNSLSFSASDTNLDTATLTIEGDSEGVVADAVDVSGTSTYDITSLNDDSYTATLTVTDTAGNVATDTVNFTRDTVIDTASIDSPSDGSVTNADTLTFSASDANLDTATLTIDGGSAEDLTGNSGSYDISALSDGSHTVTLTVTDTAGNEATDTITFTRDTQVGVTGLTATDASNQDVTVTVTSDEKLSDLTASLSGAESGSLSGTDFAETDNGDGTFTYTATYTGSTAGDYTVTLDSVSDTNGNTDTETGQSASVTVA